MTASLPLPERLTADLEARSAELFTGIVEAVGSLRSSVPLGEGRRLTLSHPEWEDGLETGASVAVDGCCLTVVDRDHASFSVEATRETLARTRLGDLSTGELVNLERPLALGARLGGHWLQGHVDGLLAVTRIERLEEVGYVSVSLPAEARALVVPQGSIALNGVSLTVLELDADSLTAAIIPHTWAATNLSRLKTGSFVHVEYDILAKYVYSALAGFRQERHSPPGG